MMSSSPLSLPFEQASEPSHFLAQIQETAELEVRADIASAGTKPLGLALASAKFVMDQGDLTVVFPGGIPRGARLMKDKLGKQLPKLVDGKTGRVLKVGRVSKGAKAAKLSASAGLIIVQAAHLISSNDNNKRLKTIEKAVAQILHHQKSEMRARVEAIYRYAKEIAGPGSGRLTKSDQAELGRLCLDLMQLRAQWREEFLYELNQIDTAKASRLPFKKDASYQKSLNNRVERVEATLESVQWMHFTLLLQMTLSSIAGRGDRFIRHTLKDEATTWSNLYEHTCSKTREIGNKDEIGVEWWDALDHLESLSTVWDLESLNSPS